MRSSRRPGPPPPSEWWRAGAEVVWLPTADEMAELDRRATGSGAIPERALIEAAGRETARRLAERWPEGPVVALAGSGHNGADAVVAARCLLAWGREVRVVLCGSGPPEPDVARGWDLPTLAREELGAALRGAAVALDGILGTGISEAPREPQARAIEELNAAGVPAVAVDGPSGADFSTGRVPGACVRAALTVSLGWPKLGLFRFPARRHCGDLVAVEIGFPPADEPAGARAITAAWVRRLLPPRPADAHKGAAGYLCLVAGQPGMAGAAALAARAALRGGAGIVRIVSDPANREILQTAVPEALFVPWDDERAVGEAVEWADAVALGPGLGRAPARRRLVERLLELRGGRPVLLDADGLNVWEGETDGLAARLDDGAVVTPHPGEAGRLLGRGTAEVLEDPPASARELARRLGVAALLKGSPSMVAREGEPVRVSPTWTPAFASGGTGDVLSGLCGAYLAAGLAPADAAACALFVGGRAAEGPGPAGRIASDLPDRIRRVRASLDRDPVPGPPGVLFASPAPREPGAAGGAGG